ncbi:MAG: hypothetical protein ACYCTV_03765 [Leptospirales bacterium]
MKKTIVDCDLCDQSSEIDITGGPGFFICQKCWAELKFSIQNNLQTNQTVTTGR